MSALDEYKKLTKNKEALEQDLKQYGDIIVTKRLRFSTGGMRGILREGFNGINEVTCNILSTCLSKRYHSIVISHDSRYHSEDLALVAARIFTKHKRKVYLYNYLVTPCLSYLVPTLKVDLGLIVTASHNPKEYNGFKVYDANGCQINTPIDEEIERELLLNETTDYNDIEFSPSLVKPSRDEVIELYLKNILKGIRLPPLGKTTNKILFTPLFGVSTDFIRRGLLLYNLSSFVSILNEQSFYDSSFPGLPFPNPEVAQVYDKAKQEDPEIIFSCDPDGDRFGLVEKVGQEYVHYNGDEIAAIFIQFFISSFESSSLAFINTFLCNDFMQEICKMHKIEYHRTKTGFKNISKKINEVKQKDSKKMVFAYEDSLGFFFGEGREKDGVKCAILMARILQSNRPSLILKDLEKYGTFSTFTYHFRSLEAGKLMDKLVGKEEGESLHDMFIITQKDCKIILRRSGTEPILKIYGSSKVLKRDTLEEKVMDFVNNKLKPLHLL